jgi:hypothetical protein
MSRSTTSELRPCLGLTRESWCRNEKLTSKVNPVFPWSFYSDAAESDSLSF